MDGSSPLCARLRARGPLRGRWDVDDSHEWGSSEMVPWHAEYAVSKIEWTLSPGTLARRWAVRRRLTAGRKEMLITRQRSRPYLVSNAVRENRAAKSNARATGPKKVAR